MPDATVLVLKCFVRFACPLDLGAAAALLSDNLFGGVRFVPTEEGDEVPGVRAERDVFGGSPRVFGEPPEYVLCFGTTAPVSDTDRAFEFTNISEYMKQQVARVEGVTVLPT
jgi:hypothetical protein